MRVAITLDLSRYDDATVLRLYRDGVLSAEEVVTELKERGLKDWQALLAVRAQAGTTMKPVRMYR